MKIKILILILFIHSTILFTQSFIKEKQTTKYGPETGSLLMIGGGIVTNEIYNKFISLAGGKEKAKIVVVTNASEDSTEYINIVSTLKHILGKGRVTIFNLKTIKESNNEKNLVPLKNATGIYFSGGRQWRISDAYLNTQAHIEFFNVLKRGGVIAGSSAGASIQGSFLWRGDTSGPNVLVGDHTEGLSFLRNSVIDQHILVRNRQFDLVDFIKISPQYVGIGIDESTAIIVQKDIIEIIGRSYVAIYNNSKEKPFIFLHKGQKFDLNLNKIIK